LFVFSLCERKNEQQKRIKHRLFRKEHAMNASNMGALPTRRQPIAESQAEIVDASWKSLYKVGGAAALLSAVFIPIQVIVFIAWPPPLAGTAGDWFGLFQTNPLIGLIDLDLLLVADNVLLIPILLALYVTLRRASESLMAIATVLGIVGIVLFITSNPAIEMLSLSDHYAAATTDAQRATFLAAGQAILAGWQGTAFQVGYLLSSVAGIAIPVVMLRGAIFSKAIAYLGILANAIGLGLYLPAIGIFLALFSVVFLELWYILLGHRLLQLGQGAGTEATN
jgi:hypothetical protein